MNNNPLVDPRRNPLKTLYEEFWVPIFGRIVFLFSSWIEGAQIKDAEQQTFNLRDKK